MMVLVLVTSECPLCHNEWTRLMPEECVIAGCDLEICTSCLLTMADVMIAGNNKLWVSKDGVK